MKKISLLMLFAFATLTLGAFAQSKQDLRSSQKTSVEHKIGIGKHHKKHVRKHKAADTRKK